MSEPETFGQHMLRQILPEDVYRPGDVLDKKGIKRVMTEIGRRYPDRYQDISYQLTRLGLKSGEAMGGASFSIEDLRTPDEIRQYQHGVNMKVKQLLDTMPRGPERKAAIAKVLEDAAIEVPDKVVQIGDKRNNRFNLQLKGAGRGNAKSVAGMLAGDMLASDSSGRPIPIPLTRGYSQGLRMSQYLADAYSNRVGVVTTKLGVAQGGFIGKLLAQSAHRAVVVVDDDDLEPVGQHRGVFVDADDKDNVGALLARDYGPYKKNTIITPRILAALKDKVRDNRLFVRSPIASSSIDSGVYAKDVGLRENGRLATRGEHVGLPSAQAISEQVTQSLLGAKHGQGARKRKGTPGLAGFPLIERLISPPKEGSGLAIHAHDDGKVNSIRPAPQGGWYIQIGQGEERYAGPDFEPAVKVGDVVEAGDALTTGNIDPAEVTRFRGIGEGRLALTHAVRKGLKEAGFPVNRRNIELLARGAIDRVEMDDEYNEFLPGDLVPYSRLEKLWKPRDGAVAGNSSSSIGRYLESPIAHYTIGTKVTPRIARDFDELGAKDIITHAEPPPFKPRVTRALDLLGSDPDYMTRFMGSNLQKTFMDSIHQSGESDEASTSFVPVRASAVDLSKSLFAT